MAAEIQNLFIEKGVDFSVSMDMQRSNGQYIDLTSTGVCVRADIVEFYETPPITGFTVAKTLPSGVVLSLNNEGTLALPFNKSYYDVVVNISGASERIKMGEITSSENATQVFNC